MIKLIKKLFGLFERPTIVWARYEGKTMRVEWSDGTTGIYVGSSVVWYYHPMMEYVEDHYTNHQLNQAYQYIKNWGGDYPDYHKQFTQS